MWELVIICSIIIIMFTIQALLLYLFMLVMAEQIAAQSTKLVLGLLRSDSLLQTKIDPRAWENLLLDNKDSLARRNNRRRQ